MKSELDRSMRFQEYIYSAIEKRIQQNPEIKVEIEERRLTGNFVKETKITFDSLIQRPGKHAANKVIAKIYEPAVQKRFCDYKYPTSIILHHILNEVPMIEDLSKVMSSGVLSKPAIMVVLQMPHYADRKQGNEEFLNSDFESFRLNMSQLVLDVHLLKNYLETRSNIDTSKLGLSGLSLGSVMGLTVGAFDQSFSNYGFLVGGVDMANILMNRVRNRPDSEVAIALSGVEKNEDKIRQELSVLDAATWLHRYRGKKMFFVSATQDDIVNMQNSVEPMVKALVDQGNRVEQKINEDQHSPTGSAIKKLKSVFLPLLNFIVSDSLNVEVVCPNEVGA